MINRANAGEKVEVCFRLGQETPRYLVKVVFHIAMGLAAESNRKGFSIYRRILFASSCCRIGAKTGD